MLAHRSQLGRARHFVKGPPALPRHLDRAANQKAQAFGELWELTGPNDHRGGPPNEQQLASAQAKEHAWQETLEGQIEVMVAFLLASARRLAYAVYILATGPSKKYHKSSNNKESVPHI